MAVTAQTPITLSGTLLDPTRAPVPGARINLNCPAQSTTTSINGQFSFPNLSPGACKLTASVPGFEPISQNLIITSNLPPLELRLTLATRKEEIDVPENERSVSLESANNAAAISVERSLLETLPILDNNYIASLSRFLASGVPADSGATLIVDGMEMRSAGVTPSAIQEIKINNNPYTVEYPSWSRRRIEIITKSSADAYHGTLNLLYRDYHLNARDPLALTRPVERRRIVEGSLFGPFINPKTTSFLLTATRETENLLAVVFAQGPLGPVNQNVPTPTINTQASLRITHQLNANHSIFVQQNFQDRWRNNMSAGGATLAEAAAQNRFREDEFVFNHRGVLKPTLISQFRIMVGRYWNPTRSNTDAPRIVVSDAFTGGSAQADRLATEFHTSITWLLTQTHKRHNFKYGINVPDWSRRALKDTSNQRGTLFYSTFADLAAARPFAATLQQGNPYAIYIEKNLGAFFQDEIQLRPGLSLAAGARYDWQNIFSDTNNFSPRLALAWSPGKGRKWILRSGAGSFFARSGPAPVYDIIRFNGQNLRTYILTPPNLIPTPQTPTSVHQLEPNIQLPVIWQFSQSLERQLTKKTLLAITYTGIRGLRQFRSRDANAPLPETNFLTRPNPQRNALRQIESAGRLANNSLEIQIRGTLAPRLTGLAQYTLAKTESNTGGLLYFPADNYNPQEEWSRADGDRRHVFNLLANAPLHPWLNLGVAVQLQSAPPFNITTGRDDNRDGLPLDRPANLPRNAGIAAPTYTLDLRYYKELKLDKSKKDKSPTLTLALDAFNALNKTNPDSFAGALSSPFFGRPLTTLPARRLQLSARISF